MTGLISCTLECNLRCEYCFEGNGDKGDNPNVIEINRRFDNAIEMFDKFVDAIYGYNNSEKTTIIWHGGEPTLIKPELMKEVMERQRNKEHNIDWRIQTNGTLINNERIQLFKEYGIFVGISIDGLKKHHDKYRVMKNGNPTFEIIKKNMSLLKENAIPFSVLVTITDNNVNELKDIYDFLASENICFSYNALYPTQNINDTTELSEDYFSDAICNLFDIWIEDQNSRIVIAPFEQIIEGILRPDRGVPACNWQRNCAESFVAIDTDGNIFPCEHWVGNKDMCLGDIDEIDYLLEHEPRIFSNRVSLLNEHDCRDCEIYSFCYGGCPWNAYILNGDVNKSDQSICNGRKKLIKHIYNYLKNNYSGKIMDLNL